MSDSLYRAEVVNNRRTRLLGEVSLAQPLALKVWVYLIAVTLVVTLVFFLVAEVPRKERVQGMLLPSGGMLHVLSNQQGNITELLVREGDEVRQGDPLFTVDNRRGSSQSEHLAALVLAQLQSRLALAAESLAGAKKLFLEEMTALEYQAAELKHQINGLKHQQSLLQQRIALQVARVDAHRLLVEQGQMGALRLNEAEDGLLLLRQSYTELANQLTQVKKEQAGNSAQSRQLPLQHQQQLRQLAGLQSELKQQIEETRVSFGTVVRAAEDGRVTAVQVNEGQEVTPGDPVLTMVPLGSVLLADLNVPGRAAGLVRVGQQVRLRFTAFPYQKYGQLGAEILQLDKSLLRPDWRREVTQNEPVYRLRAHLSEQSFNYQGQQLPLRAGMQVEADILLEKRRVLDWVLKPLLGLKARAGGL